MSDREELQALRRMAELESKSNGTTALQNSFDAKKTGNDGGALSAYVGGVNELVPFGRKATSAMGAGIAKLGGVDQSFGDLYNQAEADASATSGAHPVAGGFGTATGLGLTLPLASTAVIGKGTAATTGLRGAINAIPQLFGRAAEFAEAPVFAGAGKLAKAGNVAGKLVKSAALGAPGGALYGAGQSETGQEVQGAIQGAGVGAGLGAAFPVAKAAVGTAISPVFNAIERRQLQKTLSKTPEGVADISSAATQKIIARLRADFPDDNQFMQAVDEYASNNKSLAEIGGSRLTNLSQGAAQYPSGKAVTENYLYGKIGNTPDRIAASADKNISQSSNYYDDLDSIVKNGQNIAAPKYEEAFNSPAIISDRVNQFVNTPEMKAGMARGLKIQRLEAIAEGKKFDPKQYGITGWAAPESALDTGEPILTGVPNMRSLDAGKRGLDAMIQDNTDQFGKVNEMGRALVKFKNSYLNELDSINPAYKEARATAGDYLSAKNAQMAGKDFEKLDVQQAERLVNSFNDTEKAAYKAGVRKSISDKINNPKDNANLYKNLFGSPTQRNRLEKILGKDEFQSFSKDMASEQKLYQLREQVLGGSPTSAKQIAREDFQDEAGNIASDIIKSGSVTKTIIDRTVGYIIKKFDGLSDRTAREVATALYETDPVKKQAILNKIRIVSNKKEVKPAVNAFFQLKDATKGLGLVLPSQARKELIIEVSPKDKR